MMRINVLILFFLVMRFELTASTAGTAYIIDFHSFPLFGEDPVLLVSEDTSETPYRGPVAVTGPTISASGPLSFCPGGSVILTITGASSGSVYLWNTGQTTQSITVSATGIYSARVSSKKGQCVHFTPPVTVTVSSLNTDLNSDGVVNAADFIILNTNLNAPCINCAVDYIQDGYIDIRDYLYWLRDINKTCN